MSQVQVVESVRTTPAVEDAETTPRGVEAIGHIYANSWGIYVFAKLPYLSGGIDGDGYPEWQYFRDVVEVETVVALLRAEAQRQGTTHLLDLDSNWIS